MPQLNGSRVRHRLAEKDWDLADLSRRTGIPAGTLKNNTRDKDPQPIGLRRIYRLIEALGLPLTEIVAGNNDGVPDEPPQQPKPEKGPARRQDTEQDRKGPKRAKDEVAA